MTMSTLFQVAATAQPKTTAVAMENTGNSYVDATALASIAATAAPIPTAIAASY